MSAFKFMKCRLKLAGAQKYEKDQHIMLVVAENLTLK